MKLLHTSDWHLGHRLLEQSQYEEQNLFLNWLENCINEHQIDVLLISGDVFDTGVPATQSQKLYYDFLVNMKRTSCQHIVITGGNHDAPGTINAPKELLQALSIHVVGKATEQVEDEIFQLTVNNEKIIIAAVPYLRDQDIRRALAGESFEQLGDRYKTALVNHYTEVAAYCASIKEDNTPVIAMGHLFAIGGSTSDSEQTIYVGNLGDIGAADFPEIFDYVALGHLHRAQKMGTLDHIRYSGSPNTLSFSEVGNEKKVIVVETEVGKVKNINEVPVPTFREIKRISGTVDACIAQLKLIDQEEHKLRPWVEVVLDNTSNTNIGFAEINKAAENLNLQVLKVTFKNERKMAGLEKLIENARHVKELSPLEVFLLKCKEQDFDITGNPEIMDAFHEVLELAKER
ncbi:MAG: exonuclease SbcCD subunit D C-terminal domain-containing protein [Prolixibacteraceae bacterium]